MIIRPTEHVDVVALQAVLDATNLFASELLPEMIASYLSGDQGASVWLTCEAEGTVVGFCYAVPETFTEGAWNMLAIAVLPAFQGNGCGGALVTQLQTTLKSWEQRILLADTSGAEAFAQTRSFYRKNGYTEEACIRDFWADGDDKIVFWKSLG